MLSDLQFSFRQMVKSPGFTLIAILTLAIGIGANTAIFSLVNVLLLKPLPYPESDNLVQVFQDARQGANDFAPLSGGLYLDIESRATQFEAVALARNTSLNLTGGETPQRLTGLAVSANYLSTLGTRPAIGADFTRENETPGGNTRVALLSDSLWRKQFGADPAIINSSIVLDHQSHTVLGVLPPNALLSSDIDFLVPAAVRAAEWKQRRTYDYVCAVIARLKEGTTIDSAVAELEAMKASMVELYPDMMKDRGYAAQTLQESTYGNYQPYVLTLLVAVGMVLLIACTNVANLLLARATARQGEMAVRAALGASPWKIARQLLCESLLLAALGGLVGLVLGIVSLKPLALAVGIDELPNSKLEIDPVVLSFTVGISVLTGLFFGAFPALKAMRIGVASGLRDTTRSVTSAKGLKVQSTLIVTEIALTVALLASIGLLLKSFTNAFQSDPGFRDENVLTFELDRSENKSPTPEDRTRFTEQVLERIEQIPGVRAAAMVSTTPMNGTNFYGAPVWRDDQPEQANNYLAGFDSVYGDFFQAVGIPLLSGRVFQRSDQNPDSPKVAIISQDLVEDLFPDQNPIGQIVRHDNNQAWEIIGVVGSISRFGLDSDAQAMIYKPMIHWPWNTSYVVHTELPPLLIADQVKAAVLEVDPEQPIDRIRTLQSAVRDSLSGRIIMISLIGLFGVMAAFLASIGIYGLMSYLVEQRHREIGIRLAIGAIPREIVSMIFKRGLQLTIFGIAIGLVAVIGLGRYLAFVLYQVTPYDPVVLSGVAVLTVLIASLACWRPASVASKVNPADALRLE